ncbi:MAG TPA: hypothetical protein VK363_00370 [Pyrinomonadaceae bacterium]|nr:hypothetical protein [Pyrinomonadaceae bacterium]
MYYLARCAALMLTCGLTFASGLHNGTVTQQSDRWQLHSIPEVVQGKDKSVPVVVTGISYYSKKAPEPMILGVRLLNRSPKKVKAVSIRWLITVGKDRIERKRIYQWHKMESVEIALISGQMQEIKLQNPEPDMTAEPFVKANRGEQIEINIGVGVVEFDDGSTWSEPEPTSVATSNNMSQPTRH